MLSLFAIASPASIVPGQPFEVAWGICRGVNDPPPPAATAVSLSWRGRRLFPLEGRGERGAPQTILIDRNRLREVLRPEEIGDLYRDRGPQIITVVTTLADGRTLMADASFRVRNDLISPGGVTFTGPAARGRFSPYPGDVRLARWKSPYVVAVSVRNPLAFAAGTLTLSLFEVENLLEPVTGVVTNTPAGTPTPIQMTMPTLVAGETREVQFNAIPKDWPWIADGVWLVSGPVVRGFTYDVRFTVTDEFGNTYPQVISAPIRVEVEVSPEKLSQQMSAAGLMVFAGTLTVAAIAWPPAKAIASAVLTAAAAAGKAAKDPPEPDPVFKKRVKMNIPKLPGELLKAPHVERLRDWLGAAQRIAVTRQAMFSIEAKAYGAMAAKDRRAERVQVGDYILAYRQLAADVESLRASFDRAAAELLANVDLDAWRARLEAWRDGRPDQGELQEVAKGLPPEILGVVSEALRSVDPEHFDPKRLLAEATRHLAGAVSEQAKEYAAVYLRVLAQRGEGVGELFGQGAGGEVSGG